MNIGLTCGQPLALELVKQLLYIKLWCKIKIYINNANSNSNAKYLGIPLQIVKYM